MLGPLLAMPSGQGLNMTLLAILKVNRAIFQDTKIEDIPPIILQANFYLILGLAPQQKPNQIEDIL